MKIKKLKGEWKMKKISLFLFLLLSFVVPVMYAGTCTVDATTTNQYIHCIGASSAWSSIGSMGTALFADDNVNGHLGLSSLRARIDPNNSFSSEVNTLKQAITATPECSLLGHRVVSARPIQSQQQR